MTGTCLDRFQGIIVATLIWLMAVMVLVTTIDVIYALAISLIFPPYGLQVSESLSFFGQIFLVFIGVELLETFKAYNLEKKIRVQVVLMVAMTAIARKIVLFDMGEASDALEMLGMAAIMVSIAVGYYLVKKSEP